MWNVGTWSSDANGELQVVDPRGGAYGSAAELRGSRPVLRGRGGETPPRYSPSQLPSNRVATGIEVPSIQPAVALRTRLWLA